MQTYLSDIVLGRVVFWMSNILFFNRVVRTVNVFDELLRRSIAIYAMAEQYGAREEMDRSRWQS